MSKIKYTSNSMLFSQLENKVTLPTFQRRFVWSKSAKKEFINTLHNGFPFGFILLHRYAEDRGGKYNIIDGLERFTTIQDFKNNPETYIEFDSYATKIFDLLNMNNANNSTKDNTIRKSVKLFKSVFHVKINPKSY